MNLEMPVAPSRADKFVVGAEIGPTVLRAGVFTSDGFLKGKAKVSAKLERGADAVLARLARCVRYAVDECDLPMDCIERVGIAMPGEVDRTGLLVRSSPLGWGRTNVAAVLGEALHLPAIAGQLYELDAFGILSREFPGFLSSRVLVLIPNPQVGAAFVEDGISKPFADWREGGLSPELLCENVVAAVEHPIFGRLSGRELRKALKKDPDGHVMAYAMQIAARTGEVAAGLSARYQPEKIVLGGVLADEIGGEVMSTAQGAYAAAGGRELPADGWAVSALGDLAGMTGAAWLAKETRGSIITSVTTGSSLERPLPV